MGYHINKDINKGVYGKTSKIREELEELEDAEVQQNKILALVEMSDLYGALEAVVTEYGYTMLDLKKMSDATKSAFIDGERKNET